MPATSLAPRCDFVAAPPRAATPHLPSLVSTSSRRWLRDPTNDSPDCLLRTLLKRHICSHIIALSFSPLNTENEHRNRELSSNAREVPGFVIKKTEDSCHFWAFGRRNWWMHAKIRHLTQRHLKAGNHRYISFDIRYTFEIITIELRKLLKLLQCEKATKA
ncbi:hypothetical protein [Aminobacter carboxidus]|uniref:Uncharacterized protein n=1 Tax=Aminobacter carboxidus TaxID=376165 RepID=A0ABR9GID8_9HYPH|nr:hypothetical protein [Aminobacter carboxidus]MBE1203393.1 hypothetical protein [Aminobacter carboxidus]